MDFKLLYTDAAHTPEIVGANDVNNKAGRYDFTTVCYEIYFSEYGGTRSLYFFQGGVTREITIEKGKIYLIPPKIRHIDEVTKTSEDRSGFILFLKFQCEDFLGDFRIVRGSKRFEILADKFRREWLGKPRLPYPLPCDACGNFRRIAKKRRYIVFKKEIRNFAPRRGLYS